MNKELTNRQLAEAIGYALEKLEVNLNTSVKKIEQERKRIESFSIDTDKVRSLFDQANKNFEQTTRESINRLEQIKNNRSREIEIKEWIFYSFMIFATIGSIVLAVITIKLKNDVEEENRKLKNTIEYVNKYFSDNPKEKQMFDRWNK